MMICIKLIFQGNKMLKLSYKKRERSEFGVGGCAGWLYERSSAHNTIIMIIMNKIMNKKKENEKNSQSFFKDISTTCCGLSYV